MAEGSFDYLYNSLRVLVIESPTRNPESVSAHAVLKPSPLLRIHHARTLRAALTQLRKETYHACVLRMGAERGREQEFKIVAQYSPMLPIIIHSGEGDLHDSFEMARRGAKELMCPKRRTESEFLECVGQYAFFGALYGPVCFSSKDKTSQVLRYLFFKRPRTVREWAYKMGMTENQLRRLTTDTIGMRPKHALAMTVAYLGAIQWQLLESDEDLVGTQRISSFLSKQIEYCIASGAVRIHMADEATVNRRRMVKALSPWLDEMPRPVRRKKIVKAR